MSRRYQTDIRRIVGIDPAQSSLDAAETRPDLPGTVGIGYWTNGGNSGGGVSQASGPSGSPPPVTATGGSPTAGTGAMALDSTGSSFDSTNPLGSVKASTDGVYPLADIIDGTASTSTSAASGQLIPGTGSTIGGQQVSTNQNISTLNGITLMTDPTSGIAMEVRTDGMIPPPGPTTSGGANGAPTLQWADEYTPPSLYGAAPAGHHWWMPAGEPPDNRHASPYTCAAQYLSNGLNLNYGSTGNLYSIVSVVASGADYVASYHQIQSAFVPLTPPGSTFAGATIVLVTNASHPAYVPEPAVETLFPSDSKFVLARRENGFRPSVFEQPSELPLAYTANSANPLGGASRLNVGFGASRYATIEPTNSGGMMIGETGSPGGAYTGVVQVFNSLNQQVGQTTNAGSASFRPK